jgi:hypothetical protein
MTTIMNDLVFIKVLSCFRNCWSVKVTTVIEFIWFLEFLQFIWFLKQGKRLSGTYPLILSNP